MTEIGLTALKTTFFQCAYWHYPTRAATKSLATNFALIRAPRTAEVVAKHVDRLDETK